MAVHSDPSLLTEEVIDEYILTAKLCLEHRKPDGGCLGYPAALLLLSVVNAFGEFLRNELVPMENGSQKITRGEPFRVLNHSLFGQALTANQIKAIEKKYRNLLSHNARLAPDSWLYADDGHSIFVFENTRTRIYLASLYKAVDRAWGKLDREKIRQTMERNR